ncbi:MAG: hypothetical protein Q9216_006626 [Gyalolechia sp. 2 TL-2023]
MGRPPAIVFIARHGARLDAADKQWHLTSPTPYDPPLTYGGWVQSQTLGSRIGNILHNRYAPSEVASGIPARNNGIQALETAADGRNGQSNGGSVNGRNRKRKYKVIVHTSPFLRCIQTSVAISAGIRHHESSAGTGGHSVFAKHHTLHSEAQHPTHSASPQLTGAENLNTPHLSSIPEPEISADDVSEKKEHAEDLSKPCMRLDAFLGEWLSPEYFDLITPPPSSVMMLTSAKADLMRNGEYVDVPAGSYRNTQNKGNFPGGWGSGSQASSDTSNQRSGGPLSSIATIGTSLPKVQRASSHSDVNSILGPRSVSKIETSVSPNPVGYDPPTPSYAISPSDPIPPGYVAHARDACLDVDLRWDSMRQPHDWGSGGEYGEEWSAMHKRFRRGLQTMIAWYSNNPPSLSTQTIIEGSDEEMVSNETDVDSDIVLILVTHGAGCNALIGALTNQPVLLDVGMASLTMAVRKESVQTQPQSSVSTEQLLTLRSLNEYGISEEYDVKITASTEHLQNRSRTSTASLPYRSPSLASSPLFTGRYRTNSMASTTSSGSFTDVEFRLESEKNAVTGNGPGGGLTRSSSLSGGLWSKPTSKILDGATDRSLKEKAPQLSGHSPLVKEVSNGGKPSNEENLQGGNVGRVENVRGPYEPAMTQLGLWGDPRTATASEREKRLKRRWTHSEQ